MGDTEGVGDHGADTVLKVRAEGSNSRRAFVQFDVSSIPNGSTVDSALMVLCPEGVSGSVIGRFHEARRVLGAWPETGVDWGNQPAVAAAATDTTAVVAGLVCLAFEVTPDVQAWVSGSPNFGWRIADTSELPPSAELRYGSREHSDPDLTPSLIVSYSN